MTNTQTTNKRHRRLISTALIALLALFTACEKTEEKKEDSSSDDMQALSETMGHYTVESLKAQNITLDIDSFMQGMKKAQEGEKAPLSKQEFLELLTAYRKKAFDLKGAENLKQAEEFLEENSNDPNVIVLEKGKLQYKVMKNGSGDEVAAEGTPLILYEGKFVDGEVFDSTDKHGGKPIAMPLASTIPGFKEGIKGMKEGEKRRLFVHPELGYGNRSRLPPNSLLIFDVEVVQADASEPEQEDNSEENSGENGDHTR